MKEILNTKQLIRMLKNLKNEIKKIIFKENVDIIKLKELYVELVGFLSNIDEDGTVKILRAIFEPDDQQADKYINEISENKLDNILEKVESFEKLIKGNTEDRTMNFIECSQYLNLNRTYLYRLTRQGKIPCYKPHGGKLYFSKKELDQWIKGEK